MGYFSELRAQWRPLLAAIIGLASGFSMTSYVVSIMAPHFLKEFGWTKSEFALIGSLGMASVFLFPFVGRLADKIGVRATALIGVIAAPIAYLGLSMMTGDIRVYIALFLFQAVLCITTTATVYSRIVVQYVTKARGLALAIVASGPALNGVVGAPILNNFVEAHGWRAGYLALVVFSIVAGSIALLMLPPERKDAAAPVLRARKAREDYPVIFRSRAFWVLFASMLLCNIPQVVALTQLNLVLLDQGITPAGVSAMISAFAMGVLAGRFVAGVALDRFAPWLVAAIAMALPSFGLFLLASDYNAPWVVMVSVVLIGLSFGAEGDLVGFLVVRSFGVRIFSSVMGMMTATMATSASVGAALVSWSLKATGGFGTFLTGAAISVLIGSLLLLFLPRTPAVVDEAEAAKA